MILKIISLFKLCVEFFFLLRLRLLLLYFLCLCLFVSPSLSLSCFAQRDVHRTSYSPREESTEYRRRLSLYFTLCVLNFLPLAVNPTAKIHQMLFLKYTSIRKYEWVCAAMSKGKSVLATPLTHTERERERTVCLIVLHALFLFIKVPCQTSVAPGVLYKCTLKVLKCESTVC